VSVVFAAIGGLAGLILAVFVHEVLFLTILGTLLGGFAGTLVEVFDMQGSETNRNARQLLGMFRTTNLRDREREPHD
jgi:hypothetical protein